MEARRQIQVRTGSLRYPGLLLVTLLQMPEQVSLKRMGPKTRAYRVREPKMVPESQKKARDPISELESRKRYQGKNWRSVDYLGPVVAASHTGQIHSSQSFTALDSLFSLKKFFCRLATTSGIIAFTNTNHLKDSFGAIKRMSFSL